MHRAGFSPTAPSAAAADPSSSAAAPLPAASPSSARAADNRPQAPKNEIPERKSTRQKLVDKCRAVGGSLRHVGNRHAQPDRAAVASASAARPVAAGEASRQFPAFELPAEAPKYADRFPLFTLSEAFQEYVRETPLASHSAKECLDYMRRKHPRGSEEPITVHDEALGIYLQLTYAREQTALGFLTALKGRGESWIRFDYALLRDVIEPSVKKQIEEFKRKWRADKVDFAQLARQWKPSDLDREGMAAPEVVPPPPPRPPKQH